MEMSDAQFEHLVGMLAQARVEFRDGLSEVQREVREGISTSRKNQIVAQSTLDAIDLDIQKIQRTLRAHDQSLDGLTQLSKTNFEMNESILKALHGEPGSITMHHGETEESRGTGPQ